MRDIIRRKPRTALQLERMKRRFLHSHKGFQSTPGKRDLLQLYHKLLARNQIHPNRLLEKLLATKPMRTMSGVTIVSALTKPYPCPGTCIYCPDEKGMPKSYLSDEPAAARARALKFNPFEQVRQRIRDLIQNGHPTEKVELILKGGCWSAYTLNYQYWFILRCFQACNLGDKAIAYRRYENSVVPRAKDGLQALRKRLLKEQRKNEKSHHRIIGLTLETRPDMINEKTIETMRELGCTRMELGVQTLDDETLEVVRRGHSSAHTRSATALLRRYGFKIDYHLMPQLPGSTPQGDLEMLLAVFDNQAYRPDMIKVYPCMVTEHTELFEWVCEGRFQPYSDAELFRVLKEFKTRLPRYVRISRLIRDIPSHHVRAGTRTNNMRQLLLDKMKKEGLKCNCLRCREIGHQDPDRRKYAEIAPVMFVDRYEASGGSEYFLSFEDPDRQVVFGFCRLRIASGIYPAFIRELHTYGQVVGIGLRETEASQHKGLGRRLMAEAEAICRRQGTGKLAVIAGVGVRDYYRKLGYRLQREYMVKKLA